MPEVPEDLRPPTHHWYDGFRPPLSSEEKAQALADPGPTWRQYFFWEFVRWWAILFFLVVDVWVVVLFTNPLFVPGLVAGLIGVTYGEFLLYEYLWRRPNPDRESLRTEFHRTWYRPFRFGRWTPEAEDARNGIDFGKARPSGPDPKEFL
jgi:hypothetical protein